MYKLLINFAVIRIKLHLIPYGERDSAYPKNVNILDHSKTPFQNFGK